MDERILAVLKKLEQVAISGEKFWNVGRETGNFLNIMVQSIRAQTVLEIGTSNGYSGIWFAEALSHTGGKLYTVESHKERFGLAREHFGEAGVEKFVEQISGHAPEVFSQEDFIKRKLRFDLIFLDATKGEYESYLAAVMPLLKTGGLLIADNVLSHAGEVAGFLASVQQNPEFRSAVLPMGSGLLYAIKLA